MCQKEPLHQAVMSHGGVIPPITPDCQPELFIVSKKKASALSLRVAWVCRVKNAIPLVKQQLTAVKRSGDH